MPQNDTSVPPTHEKRRQKHIKSVSFAYRNLEKFQIVAKEVKLMLTFLRGLHFSLLPQRYSRTSICDDKELCPTFFVCPAFASEPQAGRHGRKHSEPYETHYLDGTRRPRAFHAARERSGSETHRHQLRTGRRRSLRQWHSDQSAPPPRCSIIREERLSPSGSERKDTKMANCLS